MDSMLNPDAELLEVPQPILMMGDSWPLLEVSGGYGMNPLEAPPGAFDVDADVQVDDEAEGGWGDDDAAAGGEGIADDDPFGDGAGGDDDGELGEDDGWDMDGGEIDMSLATPAEGGEGYYVPPGVGESPGEKWAKSSSLVAEHVAGGSFESAMQLLKEQLGITNFTPLKEGFMSTYSAARAQLPTLPSLSPYGIPLANASGQPMLCMSMANCTARLKKGYEFFQKGKFADCMKLFRSILQTIPLVVVETRQQVAEVKTLIDSCREYITATRLQIDGKGQEPERKAEMAALCAHTKLQPPHLGLALRVAMTDLHKVENFQDAGAIARKLLEMNPSPQLAQKAKQVLQVSDKNPRNKTKLDYDARNPFVICGIELKPIFKGNPAAKCGMCGTNFKPVHKGELCPTCDLGTVGLEASGINCVRSVNIPQ